MQFVLYFLV